jgi:hypothetical protein
MLITSTYDEKNKVEKCWFDSSNILYSEYHENNTNNYGNLFVTFKNGATYLYRNVEIAPDYLMFKVGGLDGSHGKAFNKHIKLKYQYEKCENKNIEEINQEKELIINTNQNQNDNE